MPAATQPALPVRVRQLVERMGSPVFTVVDAEVDDLLQAVLVLFKERGCVTVASPRARQVRDALSAAFRKEGFTYRSCLGVRAGVPYLIIEEPGNRYQLWLQSPLARSYRQQRRAATGY